MKVIPETRRAQ